MLSKKTQMGLDSLKSLALGAVSVGLVLVFALVIMGEFGTNTAITGNADAYGAYNDTLAAVTQIPTWVGTLILVGIAGVVIYFVSRGLGNQR